MFSQTRFSIDVKQCSLAFYRAILFFNLILSASAGFISFYLNSEPEKLEHNGQVRSKVKKKNIFINLIQMLTMDVIFDSENKIFI